MVVLTSWVEPLSRTGRHSRGCAAARKRRRPPRASAAAAPAKRAHHEALPRRAGCCLHPYRSPRDTEHAGGKPWSISHRRAVRVTPTAADGPGTVTTANKLSCDPSSGSDYRERPAAACDVRSPIEQGIPTAQATTINPRSDQNPEPKPLSGGQPSDPHKSDNCLDPSEEVRGSPPP